MTWLLVVLGLAIGDGPDLLFDTPLRQETGSMDECLLLVEKLADDAMKDISEDVTIIYQCNPMQGDS